MNWQIIGIGADLLAAFAVLASLIYLALQLRYFITASKSDNETEYQNKWNTMQDGMWADKEMANIYLRGSHDFWSLEPEERVVFGNWLGKMMDTQRIGMRMVEKGLLGEDLYEAGNNAVASYMKTPGARQWWEMMKDYYIHKDFIEELMARDDVGPINEVPFLKYDKGGEASRPSSLSPGV